VICLTEHHSTEQEIETFSIDHYILGAKFCKQSLKYKGTGIFVHESLAFTNIDLQGLCMEQDIERDMRSQNKFTTYYNTYNMYLQIANWQLCTIHKMYKHHSKSIL
jgi:hypothetical protein